MSIKNPYGKTYRSGIPGQGMQDNPRHYAFNEGVKAANEDWIEWVEPFINQFAEFILHGDYSNGNVEQGADEGEYLAAQHLEYLNQKWADRKKEINQ